MKGIALIRLQIGHLDSVCFLLRDDTVARSPSPSPSPSPSLSLSLCQDEGCPFFPVGGFPLFHPARWHMYLGERVVFLGDLKVLILRLLDF